MGNIPIILTTIHGGSLTDKNLKERRKYDENGDLAKYYCIKTTDSFTNDILIEVSTQL